MRRLQVLNRLCTDTIKVGVKLVVRDDAWVSTPRGAGKAAAAAAVRVLTLARRFLGSYGTLTAHVSQCDLPQLCTHTGILPSMGVPARCTDGGDGRSLAAHTP